MDLASQTYVPSGAFGPAHLAAAKSAYLRDEILSDLARFSRKSQIDHAIQKASGALAEGRMTEADYAAATAALTAMRRVLQDRPTVAQRVPELAEKWGEQGLSRFKPHIRKTMPSEKKAEYVRRRRKLAAGYFMPDELKVDFTTGQLAALAIVTQEVTKFGKCSLCIEKIAGLAGICHATARRALARAAEIGLLAIAYRTRRGETNLTNIVTLRSASWRTWIERRKKGLGLKDMLRKFTAEPFTSLFLRAENTKCNPTPKPRFKYGNRPTADYSISFNEKCCTAANTSPSPT